MLGEGTRVKRQAVLRGDAAGERDSSRAQRNVCRMWRLAGISVPSLLSAHLHEARSPAGQWSVTVSPELESTAALGLKCTPPTATDSSIVSPPPSSRIGR